MEGVVDHHMRKILSASDASGGIDSCVTEFIRVTDHTLPRRVFIRSCPELLGDSDYTVRVQLLGSNARALAANARKVAQLGAPAVDLNFGCPAKTVNKNRGGACLLDDTDLIYEIVSRVRDAVPASTPVTAKIRLGYNERDSYLKNAKAIEEAGANELFVHARSKKDGYKPPAYWGYIGEIRQALKIPVIANGEIWTVDDYFQCREQSGCNDVMLGRGLLAKPDLALAIKAASQGKPFAHLEWAEIATRVHLFFQQTCTAYPAKYLGNRLKQWLHYLRKTYPEADALFNDIKTSRNREQIEKRLNLEIHSRF
ncbi:tRNA-U20a,U20b-dihydrouridine synthase [Alteromonadaceae bacterium Bs31]|nr:tRNA-U20a,U20b-dihydrouridine synthase [Alteromonadaceae bacterium Bs31]